MEPIKGKRVAELTLFELTAIFAMHAQLALGRQAGKTVADTAVYQAKELMAALEAVDGPSTVG